MLLVHSTLGGKEDSKTPGARPIAPRLRMEAMESTVDLRNPSDYIASFHHSVSPRAFDYFGSLAAVLSNILDL